MEPRTTVMSYPTRILLGAGTLERLPEELGRLSIRRPLVVTDGGLVKAGLAERLYGVLRKAKVDFDVFDRVEPNPTEKDAFAGRDHFRRCKADGFVAFGGGSPLDAAKLMALLSTHEPPLSKYDDAKGGDQFVRNDIPPLVAIPTTAGTGSEVSRSAVAVLEDTGRKTVIFSPYLLPRVAVCDPELTMGLSPAATATTGMDAFTHCLEAYVATGWHPLADAVAIDGIGRVARSLLDAVADGKNLDARTEMMVAAIQGAMAFQKGLGACHALAHGMAPVTGLHHGLANAVLLPAVMEFNRGASTKRLARVAVAMGDNSLAREEVLAGNAIERVRRMNATMGIASRLRDVGVQERDLPRIAAKAFEDASHLSNPRKCSEEDLLALLKATF